MSEVKKKYGAYVKVSYDLFVRLNAGTLEDALIAAKKLKAETFSPGNKGVIDVNDWDITIEGVNDQY
jgi:hypothetical protein